MGEEEFEKSNKDLDLSDSATRMEAAIAMRVYGAPYSEIARVCGYANVAAARQAVERGLAATVGNEDKAQRRLLESRRIERMIRSVMGRATNEKDEQHLGYVRTALALVDRHARLWGLDAPQEMILYNPSAGEIEAWLDTKRQLLQKDLPEEADIIEGHVIESDLGDDD